jgi:hypothetical protein
VSERPCHVGASQCEAGKPSRGHRRTAARATLRACGATNTYVAAHQELLGRSLGARSGARGGGPKSGGDVLARNVSQNWSALWEWFNTTRRATRSRRDLEGRICRRDSGRWTHTLIAARNDQRGRWLDGRCRSGRTRRRYVSSWRSANDRRRCGLRGHGAAKWRSLEYGSSRAQRVPPRGSCRRG